MTTALERLGSLVPELDAAPAVDVFVHDTYYWGPKFHHPGCDIMDHLAGENEPARSARLPLASLLSGWSHCYDKCWSAVLGQAPALELTATHAFLDLRAPAEQPWSVSTALRAAQNAMAHYASRTGQVVQPRAAKALDDHADSLLAARQAWIASDAALETLRLVAALKSDPSLRSNPNAAAQCGLGRDYRPRSVLETLSAPPQGKTDPRPAIKAALSALAPSGWVLAKARGTSAAQALVCSKVLQESLERFALPGDPSVMVLPRELEPLARHPEMAAQKDVLVGVAARDPLDVLEAAAQLLREGIGTPALALKAARALA
jgi:hypothetical protein